MNARQAPRDSASEDLFGSVAQNVFHVFADIRRATFGIKGPCDVGKVRQQPAVLLLAFAQSFFRTPTLADFDAHAEYAVIAFENNRNTRQIARNLFAALGEPLRLC